MLRDRGAINERFAELQAGVKREILVFTKPPYATPPQENVEGLEVTKTHQARSVYELSAFEGLEAEEIPRPEAQDAKTVPVRQGRPADGHARGPPG